MWLEQLPFCQLVSMGRDWLHNLVAFASSRVICTTNRIASVRATFTSLKTEGGTEVVADYSDLVLRF